MRILISNDDGVDAEGLEALVKVFSRNHEVVVSAPLHQQSGMAHALSYAKYIELIKNERLHTKYGIEAWAVDGTPTDCIKLYLEEVGAERLPDIVISGINHGSNLAVDVTYSGTIGAAMEGFLHKIPSLAISLYEDSEISYDEVAGKILPYTEKLFAESKEPFFYNVNFPQKFNPQGTRFVFARQGGRYYANAFHREVRDGRVFYLVEGDVRETDCGEGTDIYAVHVGLIAVTPLTLDMTDYHALPDDFILS